jgi:hypothetical protein
MTAGSKAVAKRKGTSNRQLMVRQLDGTQALMPQGLLEFFTPKQIELLMEPTPREYVRQRQGKGGKMFDYVPIAYWIERANLIFGLGWSSVIQGEKLIEWRGMPFEYLVWGYIEVPTKDGGLLRRSTGGGMMIEYKKNADKTPIEPLSFSDAFKGAVSDMTSKALSGFGMFLDIYDKDGQIAGERSAAQAEVEAGQAQAESKTTVVEGKAQPVSADGVIRNKDSFLREAAKLGYDLAAIGQRLPADMKPYDEAKHDAALAVLQAAYAKEHANG